MTDYTFCARIHFSLRFLRPVLCIWVLCLQKQRKKTPLSLLACCIIINDRNKSPLVRTKLYENKNIEVRIRANVTRIGIGTGCANHFHVNFSEKRTKKVRTPYSFVAPCVQYKPHRPMNPTQSPNYPFWCIYVFLPPK